MRSVRAFPSLASSLAGRSPSDWIVGSLGIVAAAVSVSFAAYMVVTGPQLRVAAGTFPVFAAFDHRKRDPETSGSPVTPAVKPLVSPNATTEIDFTPTGSIVEASAGTRHPHPDLNGAADGKTTQRIRHITLRDVFDGKALVESNNSLHIVLPGSILEGAGTVLSIRRHGRSWVVETTGGLIEN